MENYMRFSQRYLPILAAVGLLGFVDLPAEAQVVQVYVPPVTTPYYGPTGVYYNGAGRGYYGRNGYYYGHGSRYHRAHRDAHRQGYHRTYHHR